MPKPQPCFTLRRHVDMAETDMAGIVHFSNFFNYMESTEAAFFRHLGFPMVDRIEGQLTGWPRVRAQCSYMSPLRFGELFEVALYIRELKLKAVCYQFRFWRVDADTQTGDLLAKGSMTTVFARFAESGHMVSAQPPEALWQALQACAPKDARFA